MTVSSTRQGGRRIELYLPFTVGRKRIRAITLHPLRWDQSLKWQQGGHYQSALHLLFDVADQPEEVMREIRFPDVERVMMMFVDLVPNEIRESVVQGMTTQPAVGVTTEQLEGLLARHRQAPEPEYVQVPEQDSTEQMPEQQPEPSLAPAPEEYDKTVKTALADGKQPWPGFPWAPGTPGPDIPLESKPEPNVEDTGVGFDSGLIGR